MLRTHLIDRLPDGGERGADALDECPARFGQADAAGRAMKQPDAQRRSSDAIAWLTAERELLISMAAARKLRARVTAQPPPARSSGS
jgi:hypothetical protein